MPTDPLVWRAVAAVLAGLSLTLAIVMVLNAGRDRRHGVPAGARRPTDRDANAKRGARETVLRRVLAVVLATLVVLSGVTVVSVVDPAASPIGTARAADSPTHIVEAFEDDDTNVEADGWTGWKGDTASLGTTSTFALHNDFSGNLTSNNAHNNVEITSDSGNYTNNRIAIALNISADTGNFNDDVRVQIKSGNTNVFRIHFEDGTGDIQVDGGTVDTGENWNADTIYHIEFRDIDWSADTYDLYLNAEQILNDRAFENNAAGFDEIEVQSDSNSKGSLRNVRFDNIETGGSNFTTTISTGLTENFEDDDALNPNTDGWDPRWYFAQNGDAGDLTEQTGTVLEGTTSLEVNTSNENVHTYLQATSSFSLSRVESHIQITNDTGDNLDEAIVQLRTTEDTSIISVYFKHGADNNITAHGATFDTGEDWNVNREYNVTFADIDWSANTYDLWINGTRAQDDLAFNNNADEYDRFLVGADTSSSGSSFDLIADDIRAGLYTSSTFCLLNCGNTVSGTVENQQGDPVQGATVQVWGVDYDQLSPGAGETKKGLAIEEFREAWNKTTSEWTEQRETNFRLVGSNGHFGSVTATYAAVHTQGDWNRPFFQAGPVSVDADPQLGDPLLHVPASGGEAVRVYVSLWDATREPLFQDGVDEDLPGVTTTGTIVVKGVSATGEILDERRVETEPIFKTGVPSIGKTHEAAIVTLPPGYYRVHPAGNAAGAYVMKVGNPPEFISDALDTETGALTSQASDVAQDLTSGKFTKDTATTSADGSWSVETGSSVKTVAVQAFKAESVATNDSGLTPEEIIAHYDDCEDLVDSAGSSFGAVYLPSDIERVDPPASNVTVELREVSVPSYGDLEAADFCVADRLRDLLNESYADALGILQQRLDDATTDDLRTIYTRLKTLYQENQDLKERVDELRDEDGDDTTVIIDEGDATEAELRDRIRDLSQAVEELRSTIEGTAETTVGSGTISQTFTFDTDIDPASTLVLVHYSNGTTNSLDTASPYVRVNKRPGRPDQVLVEEYPLGETDPSSVVFEVILGSEDGTEIGRSRNRVVNPQYSGQVPGLDSIRVTTLRPGPSEHVTVEVNPSDSSVFGSVTGVTVVGPDGNTISTDAIETGDTSGFTTDGSGTYHVEVAFNNSDGDAFTETFRLRAASTDDPRPATVEVRHGATGSWVLAGDGLSGGRVTVEDSGATVAVTARVAPGDDVPGSIHVHTEGVDTSPRTITTVRVVRGEHDEAVRQRLGIVLYTDALGDTPVLYRETDALPRSGSNQHGRVTARGNGTTIQTFTESDGTVRILTDRDPGLIARGLYRARLAGVPIPTSIGGEVILPHPGPIPPPPDPVGAIEELLTEVLA